MTSIHILNGDSLKAVFPSQLDGERIVARECLVDGSVAGETIEQLYQTRAAFINAQYDAHPGEYELKSIPEFEKIRSISHDDVDITLWFEDDLFCQVNLWFVLHLLGEVDTDRTVYLVRPTVSIEYGFGGMSQGELLKAFENRIQIPATHLNELRKLWLYYQQGDIEKLEASAMNFTDLYPFLLPAVAAHRDRLSNNGTGRPQRVIKEIVHELKTTEFGKIFREFCKREPIYGFGDLQVERMWRELQNEK